ncbi:ISAs1-like element ISVer2 family transposase [Pedosphaera parvula]|uniref:Transposase IS4 family protein n=1 Tax=Pedosphaera parvula (strain Ellin514) TaxID=320771 RepID=B9XEG9_PEDPL|nr:ISAs1-like element ISVer2 family transposase [Pedosphaera parvula]EEF60367.1 transposase IS4 family protein [Pedosphaera parvula Ellin514]EEF61683.1 transposase IS4 family protein [Pedosphaera parvula Ellin514]
MQKHHRQNLIEHFKEIRDPRVKGRCDHELVDVLMIGLCCLLCGGETFNDMEDFGKAKRKWFKTFLRLRHGIPKHDTFNRVFAALKPEAFLDCFMRWTQSVRATVADEIVALDGKALRRALEQGQSPRVIVSAWAAGNSLVLGQIQVPDKTNEITAVPQLLRVLELSGCIVTLDAMGCQKEIAREIVEADANYVLALKGNQGQCHQEIKAYLEDAVARHDQERPVEKNAVALAYKETTEKDHGRLETRRYWQSGDVSWLADRQQWAGLRSVGVVESVRQVGQQAPTVERRYYLSSLNVDVEKFARAVRGHWSVENSLHWVLDVQCGEDRNRARSGHAAENLATLRRLALNLLKRESTKKRGIKGKQLNASWDHDYLLRLLSF